MNRIKSIFHLIFHGHCLTCETCVCFDYWKDRNGTIFINPNQPEDVIDFISNINPKDTPFYHVVVKGVK